MGCYVVPIVAAVVHYGMRKKNPSWFSDKYHKVLNWLFVGASVFGVVDHLWNRELFVFSLADVGLGLVITAAIVGLATIYMVVDKSSVKEKSLA